MADIAVVAAEIRRVNPDMDIVVPVLLAETMTAGQAAYQLDAGTFGIADANVAGKQQFRGCVERGGAAGQVVPLVIFGLMEGFTVNGTNADVPLFLSDTAGALADAAGTMTVPAGLVWGMSDGGSTNVVMIDARLRADYS